MKLNQLENDLAEKIKSIIDHIDVKINNEPYKEAREILISYKKSGGSQREAYNIIHQLYINQNTQKKADFVADILDMICGFIGNNEYKIWKKYLNT